MFFVIILHINYGTVVAEEYALILKMVADCLTWENETNLLREAAFTIKESCTMSDVNAILITLLDHKRWLCHKIKA